MWTPDPATIITAEAKAAQVTAEAWATLRAKRDALLAASDYSQRSDDPLPDNEKTAWATYRKTLRSLPQVTTDPTNPAWPSAPSATSTAPPTNGNDTVAAAVSSAMASAAG